MLWQLTPTSVSGMNVRHSFKVPKTQHSQKYETDSRGIRECEYAHEFRTQNPEF